MLKRFQKVQLPPGGSATVTFDDLDPDFDLAIWDEVKHSWSKVPGAFGVHVGASSRDLRLTGRLYNH